MDFDTLLRKREQGFKRTLYGYSPDEVDSYLDELLINIKSMSNVTRNLEEEIRKQKEQERVISNALVTAEKSARIVIEEAEKEAQEILKRAHTEEQRILTLVAEDFSKAQMELEMKRRVLTNLMVTLSQRGKQVFDELTMSTKGYFEQMKEQLAKELAGHFHEMCKEFDTLKQ